MPRRWIALLLPWLALAPLLMLGRSAQAVPAATFTVNSFADAPDAAPGNGVCETAPGNGVCTLRAAIREARADPNPHTIILPAGTYFLTRAGHDDTGTNGDLDVSGNVTLLGAGPASTIIDAAAINDRVFDILDGVVTIAGVTIRNGRADHTAAAGGGGVLVRLQARVTLSNTAIVSNTVISPGALQHGGGILNAGWLTVTHSTLSANVVTHTADHNGGGLANFGLGLRIFASQFSGNQAPGGLGGGLFIRGTDVLVTDSTFSHNRARAGAGIYNDQTGFEWLLINTTLSGNRARQAGGGLFNAEGNARLFNVTVTGNWANDSEGGSHAGGGLANQGISLSFANSLIAGNFRTDWAQPFPVQLDSDCAGSLTSSGANFVGVDDAACAIGGIAPLTGGFALLGPLANNGGPTPTHALLPGSPAIDAGAETGCTDHLGAALARDQRGVPRPLFGQHSRRCDLGAYEFVGPLFLPLVRR
jgi:CSLREA domain-containing protein